MSIKDRNENYSVRFIILEKDFGRAVKLDVFRFISYIII